MDINEYDDYTHQYESYEVYFAQQLGVHRAEHIFFQLMAVAKVALHDLPDGWSVGIYEDADNQVNALYLSSLHIMLTFLSLSIFIGPENSILL